MSSARSGSSDSLLQLLRHCSGTLAQDVAIRLDPTGRIAVTPEILIEDVLQQAQREFDGSDCKTESELRNWLMEILKQRLEAAQQEAPSSAPLNGASQIVLLEDSKVLPDDQTAFRGIAVAVDSISKQRRMEVEAAVNELPQTMKTIVLLHNRDGYSFDEIAARTGRTADEARIAWARAIEHLSELLQPGES